MKNYFEMLQEKFHVIKNMGYIKSLRKGPTGLGYTFETLLGKKEDQLCEPDFGNIEIKCKYKNSSMPLTLFNSAPLRNETYATRYLLDRYGYNNDKGEKCFTKAIYYGRYTLANDYKFKIELDDIKKELVMKSYYQEKFVEDVCHWPYSVLKEKLENKLSFLAIIYAQHLQKNDAMYYQYTDLVFLKLRSFNDFLNLIKNNKIFITFYMKDGKSILGNPEMNTHGVAFSIKREAIIYLFEKIN